MKSVLLLPDFHQSGEIKLWGDGMTAPIPVSTCTEFRVIDLPDCFVLGIPESLLRANIGQDFIYAQYARLKNKQCILSFSIRCGQDKSGRTVVLSLLQLLAPGQSFTFPPESIPSLPQSIDKRTEVQDKAEEMVKLLRSDAQSNIKDMIRAVQQYQKIQSFASEYTDSLAQKPQWTPLKKKVNRFTAMFLIAFSLLLLFIILF